MSSAEKASNSQSPLKTINELLKLSNIPIIISLGANDELFASKNGCTPYSVAELSDGERNVLLICSDVLTAKPNQLIIIDEPERHLHRSIISPLLSALFQKRKDCVFVISTHDIYLPIDHKESSVLLLRDCIWNGKSIQSWNADLISKLDEIPNKIKQDILGSKNNILFVEGENHSLDKQIYQLIYPNVTIIPQANCSQVEKAVTGIRETGTLHWINAFGLIDADDRTEEQIENLYKKGVASLESYSVEFLYYNLDIVKIIASKLSETFDKDENELFRNATSRIIEKIKPIKGYLCSLLCGKQIKNKLLSRLPNHKDIANKGVFEFKENLGDILKKEEKEFELLVANNDINGLISRYPLKKTAILNEIAKGLGLDNKDTYERMVRKLITDDSEIQIYYRDNLLSRLTNLISPKEKIFAKKTATDDV